MDIIKQSTGNVVLTDAAGNIQKVFVNVNALDVKGTDEVIVKFGFNQWHSLFASQINKTQVEPNAPITFSGDANDLITLLSSDFFFELSGGGDAIDVNYNNSVSGLTATNVQDAIDELDNLIGGITETQDLAAVLVLGNSAGTNDIDLNGNDILNVNEITSGGDLFLNPVGSIDCNGHNINLTGGELHNCDLIHSQNNTNIKIEGKGTGLVVIKNAGSVGNKGDFLQSTGAATTWVGLVYTVELIDALTVDFYAPYDLKINTTTNIKNAPTISILDDGVAYTLTNTIAVGSKITVTASVAGVVNLNITKA